MLYTAEIFDRLQKLFNSTGFNDNQLHCIMKFRTAPKADVLKKGVIASIHAIPILGTCYTGPLHAPRWESLPHDAYSKAFSCARTQDEFEQFVISRIDETTGPQVNVCMLETGSPAVAVIMNHMVCDAAGFKEYLYFLCNIYSRLLADPGFIPPVINGDRSMREIFKQVGIRARLASFLLGSGDNNDPGNHRFTLDENTVVTPFILTHKLDEKNTAGLQRFCKSNNATLNDAVLTSYYRCLFKKLALKPGETLSIPVMVDMRRYLASPRRFDALTNLSSTVITRLAYHPGEDFSHTLARVKTMMDSIKEGKIGLNGFTKLNLVHTLFPSRIAHTLVKSGLRNPLICMTNTGILDPARLAFGSIQPSDAFLCGSIKYKPHFQVAMSSYNNELTLSSNLYGSDEDRKVIEDFLVMVARELPQA